MKEDQLLKELLQNNLMEETSTGFTDGIMQRIKMASSSASYTRSIWQDKFFKIIAAAFIFVSVLLLLMTLPLKKITKHMYQSRIDTLSQGYSHNYIDSIHTTGNMIFKHAIRQDLLRLNPTIGFVMPKKQITVQDIEDFVATGRRLAGAAADHRPRAREPDGVGASCSGIARVSSSRWAATRFMCGAPSACAPWR